jgi:hypothetical protein
MTSISAIIATGAGHVKVCFALRYVIDEPKDE